MGLPLAVSNKLPVVRKKTELVSDVIGAFESETAAVYLNTAPTYESTIMAIIGAMIVFAIVLTCFVKVDRVVESVAGIIMTSAGSIYVDPLNPAVVRSVNVKAGQVVKKGQALATLDPTFTQADLDQALDRTATDKASIAREEAELAKRPYEYSTSDKYQATQGAIWRQRQAQYKADLANFDGQIASAEAQMTQAKSDEQKYSQRLGYASQAEHLYKPLLDKGYVSQIQVLQASDERTEMSRLLADAQNQISQYQQTATALKAQRESYIQKWFSDTGTQLVADRNDLALTVDSLQKNQKLQDMTSLDSPEDAIVVKVGKLSKGSIAPGQGQDAITPGSDPLFTLVPLSAPVEAEVDIATSDIGFIAVGNPVEVKLDSYSFVLYGMAWGTVKSISEGSFSVDANNTPVAPYFKVKVRITKLLFHDVPSDFRLIPGMTLVADVLVGKRTIMSYFTETLMRQGEEALREPQ